MIPLNKIRPSFRENRLTLGVNLHPIEIDFALESTSLEYAISETKIKKLFCMAVSVCDSYAYSYLAFCINIFRRIFQCATQAVPVGTISRARERCGR